jgi:hypothetical protein
MKRHAKNPFRQTGMRKMYAACLELAADSNSEFYVKGAEKWMRRTGAMHRTSFWAGVEAFESGGPRPFSARSYTLSRAAFQAGKDFAEKQQWIAEEGSKQ